MELPRRKDRASRPWRLSAKLLILFALATVIGFSAICVGVILEMRRGEELLARQSLKNLPRASMRTSAATSNFTTCRCARW